MPAQNSESRRTEKRAYTLDQMWCVEDSHTRRAKGVKLPSNQLPLVAPAPAAARASGRGIPRST